MLVIKADNLSKVYKLYDKPSDRLKELVLRKKFHKDFSALNGISFSVEKGQALGACSVFHLQHVECDSGSTRQAVQVLV